MKNLYKIIVFLFLCQLFIHSPIKADEDTISWSSRFVFYGEGGKMEYAADEKGNTIPDFSHVGFYYGDDSIPEIPVVKEISPVEGDDYVNIQTAINEVSEMPLNENGFRGAILLKKGEYQLKGSLYLQADGVVLRGEGNTKDGTVIVATGTSRRALIQIGINENLNIEQETKTKMVESYVPVGQKYVRIENPELYNNGDQIVLYRSGTEQWISDIKMDQIPYKEGVVQWTPESYSFYYERIITRIKGDTIFFRNPVVMTFDENYGGGLVYKCSMPRYKHIGVENMLLKSEYAYDTDEDHAWDGVVFKNAEHSWARGIISKHFAYSCVTLGYDAKHISVLNCQCLDPKSQITGGRRYSFTLKGQLNLFKNCFASNGRHDFVSHSRVSGPNVFTQCSAINAWSDSGPHHRWAMGTLFDSINTEGDLNVQDRGNSGTGHGWAGVSQIFWNCQANSSVCQSPWASGKNYNIGFQGYKYAGWNADRPDGVWEGQNKHGLFPSSLYQAQLIDRTTDKKYFSVISDLERLNDSTFRFSYNLPVNPDEASNKNNYVISGNANLQTLFWSISLENNKQVLFTFYDIPLLKHFSTVIIRAENVYSKNSLSLNALSRANYTEPDRRPVVFYNFQRVNNGPDDYVTAISSKSGKLFLIEYDVIVETVFDLENAVDEEKGMVKTLDEDQDSTTIKFQTQNLKEGKYIFYAADEKGRLSRKPSKFVYIENVTSVELQPEKPEIIISPGKGTIRIIENQQATKLKTRIYTIQGVLIYQGICEGETVIPLPGQRIYLIRIFKNEYAIETQKVYVH